MKRNKSERQLIVAVILSVALSIFGGFLIYSGFEDAAEEMSVEYSSHLQDTARVIDSSVASMLSDAREQLRHMISFCREAGEHYFVTRDPSELIEAMSSHPIMSLPYADCAVLIYRETVLMSSPGESLYDYSFPNGVSLDRPCICVYKDSRRYIALVERCVDVEYRYAVLLDPLEFYRQCIQEDMSVRYWLSFYDCETGLFMQNDSFKPEISYLSYSDAVGRNDETAILAEASRGDSVVMRQFENPDEREKLMVVMPAPVNKNGVFALGLAQSTSGFMSILSQVFVCIMMGTVLILLSIFAMLMLIYHNRRSNRLMREKVELLEKENKTIQELAHHQRLEMIGTMTGNLVHEFNNMLTPIMGYSLMTMEQLPEGCDELMDNLSAILESAEKAKGLVSRMSSLTRKNPDAANKLLSPDVLVQKVRHITVPSQPAKVELILDCRCPDIRLFANETQIIQLLMNIVINAFQAMEDEGGTLTISTRYEEGNVVFRLADTGPGIPEDILSRMFEPFFTTKEVGRGTGLGLAIATQIAETHNGSIRAESKVGEGTVFIVTLPASKEKLEIK